MRCDRRNPNVATTKNLRCCDFYCRRSLKNKGMVIFGVIEILFGSVKSAEGFCSTTKVAPSSGELLHANKKRTYLRLVETDVACSSKEEQTCGLATPFRFISTPSDIKEDGKMESVEMAEGNELLSTFFVQENDLIEKSNGGIENCDDDIKDQRSAESQPRNTDVGEAAKKSFSNQNESNNCIKDQTEKAKITSQTANESDLYNQNKKQSANLTTKRSQTKTTSVASHRVGCATKPRSSTSSITRPVQAVRTVTRNSGLSDHSNKNEGTANALDSNITAKSGAIDAVAGAKTNQRPVSDPVVSRAMIESTVECTIKASETSLGLFGEPVVAPRVFSRPKPGTTLIKAKKILSNYANDSAQCNVDVRVATTLDDVDIADLRLSVFSDLTPETRKIFCDRSRYLLSSRRQRGAICIVATEPQIPTSILSPNQNDHVVGTAEISFHEFVGTRLGRLRPENSILYVTEVAVNSKYRRKGVARSMMEAIDKIAKIRKAETIYLHVDLTNVGAIRLYEKAGFKRLPRNHPVFNEFTTKLNLHDGATKGRKHFLMAKDLMAPMWLEDIDVADVIQTRTQKGTMGIDVMR